MVENVSFIVIALNEEFAIRKCLDSIANMRLSNCEVICVDSGSKDRTLEIMKSYRSKFQNFKIYVINGYSNSAIARNIGLRSAKKECVFFVDGDVELNEIFIILALHKIESGFSAVTGDLVEYQYSVSYKDITRKIDSRDNIKGESYVYYSGGTFLIKREIVKSIGLFDEKFERSQDWEFTLRLTRKYKMVAIPQPMGIHHTVPYEHKGRIKTSLKHYYPVYMGMIIRRNILNCRGLIAYLRGGTIGVMLGLTLIVAMISIFLIFPTPQKYVLTLFPFIADIVYGKLQGKNIRYRLILHYLYPLYLLVGLLSDIDRRKKYSIMPLP